MLDLAPAPVDLAGVTDPFDPRARPEPGSFSPLPGSERIQLIDSLRGFALLGIVVVNMSGFKFPIHSYSLSEAYFPGMANLLAKNALMLFASGKFVSIFALLFGLGLVLQEQRAVAAGRAFRPFIRRRMTVLLVLGVLHGIFLWAGDILVLYSVFGFASPLLLKLRLRATVVLTGLVASGFLALRLAMAAGYFDLGSHDFDLRNDADAWIEAYRHDDFGYLVQLRFHEWRELSKRCLIGSDPYALFFFLGGIALGKADVLSKLGPWRARMVALAKVIFPVALVLELVSLAYYAAWIPFDPVLHFASAANYFLGSALLSFVYLAGFTCFFQSGRAPALHAALADVGRLSLSNYLLQSLIANLLFMYWGLGLYGQVPAHLGFVLSILIFALQIVLSRVWLRHFPTGPAEWLWRRLSYPRSPGPPRQAPRGF